MNIVFYGRVGRPFNGNTINEEGCGGSESALIYMAASLSSLGHDVKVFNRCDRGGNYGGVIYDDVKAFGDFLKGKPTIDILVIFRDIDFLKILTPGPSSAFMKAKVYWAHDDLSYLWGNEPLTAAMGSALNENADRLFAVSNWQKEIYVKYFGVKDEKIYVTRNGVDFSYYENTSIAREPFRLIYTSVPDRGLDVLLDVFRDIRKELPVELYLYSSFSIYGPCREREEEGKILEKGKQPHVHLMKPLPRRELAKELTKSRLMLYPNHKSTVTPVFGETSSMAVLEAQAAGTPVITSNRGALPESVVHGQTGILIDGDPYSKEYKEKFISETIRLLKDETLWQRLSENGRKRMKDEFSWTKISKEWHTEFEKILRTKR